MPAAALKAADLALFVVSGVDGIEVQTEQLWKVAAEEGIAAGGRGHQARSRPLLLRAHPRTTA